MDVKLNEHTENVRHNKADEKINQQRADAATMDAKTRRLTGIVDSTIGQATKLLGGAGSLTKGLGSILR